MKTYLFKLCFFLNFIICSNIVFAQDYSLYIDSLKKVLLTAPNDTNKVYAYSNIAYSYQWSNPDSALLYALPGLALARKLNFENGEYDILRHVTEALSMKGNYSKALEFRFRSTELANQLKNPTKIANSLALTGLVYSYSKNYNKALEYFYKAQKTNAVTLGGPKILSGFIGEAYFNLHTWDSALVYIQRAYDLDTKDTNSHWSIPYQYLAALYEQKGNFVKSIGLYRLSLIYAQGNIDILKGYNGISSVYQKTGQTDSAIFYAEQVISLGTTVSIPAPVIDASALLVEIYKSRRNTDSAFKYQEILMASKDSLFSQDKIKQMQNVTFDEQLRQQELQQKIEQNKLQYKNRLNIYILLAGLLIVIIIAGGLWRRNIYRKKSFTLLQKQKQETDIQKEKAETTLEELRSTQSQLIQSEKMASLGELTAGIAHEIQNPLNFVNNFSEVNKEMLVEVKDEMSKGNLDDANDIANDVIANEEKINHHGKRADAIVKGMLQHSRSSSSVKEPTDINKLADEYLRLAYHGLRAKDKSFNAAMKTDFDESIGNINIIPQDIGRVILNLITNAFYVVDEKKKSGIENYEPAVSISTKKVGDKVLISVKDNGNGIPQKVLTKIFQPFFTTKPTGQGTGLGLSLSYDIIKAHGGEIKVETKESEGSTFIIQLPII